jgi:hypothetical protein
VIIRREEDSLQQELKVEVTLGWYQQIMTEQLDLMVGYRWIKE